MIVDIDGVLADAEHRQHLLRGRRRWGDFFARAGDDSLIEEFGRLLELLTDDLCVVLLTARPVSIHAITVHWLEEQNLRWDLLVMRPPDDYDPSPIMKMNAVGDLRDHGFDPQLALDDDPRNVTMFRRLDIPCIEVPSGYHGLHGGRFGIHGAPGAASLQRRSRAHRKGVETRRAVRPSSPGGRATHRQHHHLRGPDAHRRGPTVWR